MRICKRGLECLQVTDAMGNVRGCAWMSGCYNLGSLLKSSMKEIYHSENAKRMREQLRDGGAYKFCDPEVCIYIASGELDNVCVDIDEIPEYPSELSLSFEAVCNYRCPCCYVFGSACSRANDTEREWGKNYDIIEERLRECMPYAKTVGANGLGELFVSRRALRLLSEWKPLADPSEVSVSLETNGSLFNEKNWEKISNLGQYHVDVTITVMSFDEYTYQYLSGTSMPIANLIDNLKFVRSLREKEIIDHLEITNVVQQLNFRETPDFVRRCLDEFGADRVRMRPLFPSSAMDADLEWFSDVRNSHHPHNSIYKKVMADPVFTDPRVAMWANYRDSLTGGEFGKTKGTMTKRTLEHLNDCEDLPQRIASYMSERGLEGFAIYGMGRIGKLVVDKINNKLKIDRLYDKFNADEYISHAVEYPDDMKDAPALMIVTPMFELRDIENELRAHGFRGSIVGIDDILAF